MSENDMSARKASDYEQHRIRHTSTRERQNSISEYKNTG